MFDECSSLIKLPDISKWNVDRNCIIFSLFYKCSSLIEIPDISNWKTDEITDMNSLFGQCSSLIKFLIYLNGI